MVSQAPVLGTTFFSQSPRTYFVGSQRVTRAFFCSVGVSLCGVHMASRTPDGSDTTFAGPQKSTPGPTVHDPQNPHADSWSSVDQIDLGDVFQQRIPTLKSAHISSVFASGSVSLLRCVNGIGQRSWGRVRRNACADDVAASAHRFRVCWKRRVAQARGRVSPRTLDGVDHECSQRSQDTPSTRCCENG